MPAVLTHVQRIFYVNVKNTLFSQSLIVSNEALCSKKSDFFVEKLAIIYADNAWVCSLECRDNGVNEWLRHFIIFINC